MPIEGVPEVPKVAEAVELPKVPEVLKMPEVPKVPEKPEAQPTPPPVSVTAPAVPAAPPKDEVARRLEKIMEEDLSDLFWKMSPATRQVFKVKGEETAAKIRALLDSAKVKAKDILKLIKDWLKLIPGVNRFFLEQEAKIKTDRIMNLRERL